MCFFPAAKYGPLHFWVLEESKIQAVKDVKGNFDDKMTIHRDAGVGPTIVVK